MGLDCTFLPLPCFSTQTLSKYIRWNIELSDCNSLLNFIRTIKFLATVQHMNKQGRGEGESVDTM